MSDPYDLDSGPDPAAYASAAPEPPRADSTDRVVHAVGIGPGTPSYLSPRGEHALSRADVVVGFEAVVERIEAHTDTDATCLACGYQDEAAALTSFAGRVADGASGVAVLMGDPNHSGYQFLGKVERHVDAATDGTVVTRVVPGISSIQVAASRARTPIEDATFVTLHQSGSIDDALARLRRDAGERHLLVLPRPFDWMPGDIAADLLEHGAAASADALVCERLTHETETITRTTLGELSASASPGGDTPDDTPFSALSVLVVRA